MSYSFCLILERRVARKTDEKDELLKITVLQNNKEMIEVPKTWLSPQAAEFFHTEIERVP
jgi:hypothetical protein